MDIWYRVWYIWKYSNHTLNEMGGPKKQLFLTALKREAPNIFKDVLQDSPVDATFYLKWPSTL